MLVFFFLNRIGKGEIYISTLKLTSLFLIYFTW